MNYLKIGSRGEDVRALQKALAKALNVEVSFDGQFGAHTERLLSQWQKLLNINEKDGQGKTIYGEQTNAVVGDYIESTFITETVYANAAEALGVETAAIKAFAITESKSKGFFSNGFPVILFERHKFYKAVRMKFGLTVAQSLVRENSNICNPIAGGYIGNEAEIPRLEEAAEFDWQCAHASASWGAFQLMGFNYNICGHRSLEDFIAAMKTSEIEHLNGFVEFIKSNPKILQGLRAKNWRVVAAGYNGIGNVAFYSAKMQENYNLAIRN